MKLRKVALENVRSFLERQEFELSSSISIIIGPNGGGKTNLIDAAVLALRAHLLRSWIPRHNPTDDWQDRYDWVNNDALQANLLERHSGGGADRDQIIELHLEVTQPDFESMQRTKAGAIELQERAKSRYTSFPGSSAANWNLEGIQAGAVFQYTIKNGALQEPQSEAARTYQDFLQTFEVNSRVREEYEERPLSTPMIALPVTRSSGDMSATVTLSSFNEHDLKRNVDAASSRATGSIAVLAIGRMASRYRALLEKADGQTKQEFSKDSSIQAFTEMLKSLGYTWDLVCTDKNKNRYEMHLSKQGSSFRVGAASSGERELLTYLFAIYALNVRDALIAIDEPELHLHPRWQRTLLELFEKLSKDTGNQFFMATHSPVFVSPDTIQYVSRVYSENQRSRIVRLSDSGLPDAKHLFSIVNSQNNERIFFSDLVILVEGISDRIFFESLFRIFAKGATSGRVYEVVSVGGKTLFTQYEKLLNACKVPFVIIADLDYLRETGSELVRKLFSVSARNLKNKVLDEPFSVDAIALVTRMDDAIRTGNLVDLKTLWEYIKGRQTRIRSDLSAGEKSILHSFIQECYAKGVFVLEMGALEAYLPNGYKGKDLEKVIQLATNPGMWDQLPESGRQELKKIVDSIPF